MSMVLDDMVGGLRTLHSSKSSYELNNLTEMLSFDSSEINHISSVNTNDSFYTDFIESVLDAVPTVPRHCSNVIDLMNGINTYY